MELPTGVYEVIADFGQSRGTNTATILPNEAYIARRYGCRLQTGGSDQWGNIVNGIDLTRRVLDHEIYGLTTPLLTMSDGKKMGKTADGAVWLRQALLLAIFGRVRNIVPRELIDRAT